MADYVVLAPEKLSSSPGAWGADLTEDGGMNPGNGNVTHGAGVHREWTHRLRVVADIATVVLLVCAIWMFLRGRHAGAATTSVAPVASLGDSTITPLVAVDVDGRSVDLFGTATDRPRLLFVFRRDCPVCQRQKATWQSLADSARVRGVDVVAITGESGSRELGKYFAPAPITVLSASDQVALVDVLHTQYVPTTILVSGDRRIRFHHIGLLTLDNVKQLRSMMIAR